MKRIGIVAGAHPERAVALKAAILAQDKTARVVIEETALRQDAPDDRMKLGDRKIELFNAEEALAEKGLAVVAFTCACPHRWFGELVHEATATVVDPCDDAGELLPAEKYAEKLLAVAEEFPAKPFKIGMIGGLGPAATVDLYDKITKATPAKNDQEHIRVVIEQNPQIPDRTKCLLDNGEDPTLALYNCAKRLEKDGCDALIIPCNTAHAFAPYMQRHLSIPFINMQRCRCM